ncbi:hypothetical protein VSQ48_03125 [Candidatus Ventrimonas sp. KK005]
MVLFIIDREIQKYFHRCAADADSDGSLLHRGVQVYKKMEYYEERLSENLALNVQDKPEPMEIFTLLKENVSLNSRRNLKE